MANARSKNRASFGKSLHVSAANGVLRRLHIQEADVFLSALRGCELRRGIDPRLLHHVTVCVGLRVPPLGLAGLTGVLSRFAAQVGIGVTKGAFAAI